MSEITLHGKIWFGKYKGQTGDEVARTDPSYLMWVERNLDRVTLSQNVRDLAVSIGMMRSEEAADAFGDAGDWGFDSF